jgi:NarL family two-component system sensor histidine kinase LiaS
LTQYERIKIAQELHDGIAQDLVALSYSLDLLLAAPDTPASTRVEIRNLIFSVSKLIKKVRTEIFNLRNQISQSIEELLRALISDLHSEIDLTLRQEVFDFSQQIDLELRAISVELVRNTVKHAGASAIGISIRKSENGITYLYTDNGIGINLLETEGFGILGIKERCDLIEGEFSMTNDVDGLQYKISIPL